MFSIKQFLSFLSLSFKIIKLRLFQESLKIRLQIWICSHATVTADNFCKGISNICWHDPNVFAISLVFLLFFSFYCAIVKSANIIFDVYCVFTYRATLKINNFRGEYLVSGLIFFSEKYYIYRHISFIHFCTENVRFIYNFCYFLEGIISEKRSIRNQLYPLV